MHGKTQRELAGILLVLTVSSCCGATT